MLFDGRTWKWFGENVSNHVLGTKEVDFDVASFDCISNPMPLYVNVFHLSMMPRIADDA